ncbi:MAG: signal peptidase II, partial [Gammaproteobacteria bacterium]|nr:signal peptidase II [Gammaproteobacteria bacterium]
MKKSHLIVGLLATCFFIVDQLLKWIAVNYLVKPVELTSWFAFKYEENIGIAWSMPVPQEIIIPLNIILLVLIIIYLPKHVDLRLNKSMLALALIVGGALGNIFDRFAYGYVIDFISVGWWPVFNLADSFLVIGIF